MVDWFDFFGGVMTAFVTMLIAAPILVWAFDITTNDDYADKICRDAHPKSFTEFRLCQYDHEHAHDEWVEKYLGVTT